MLTTIIIVFGLCFIVERIIPGWKLPYVPTWTIRVLAVNFVQLSIVILAGVTWEKWLSAYSLFNLTKHVSPTVGGLIAYFIATFIFYWWHRWRHEVDFFWTNFHQIHHSPQRIEVVTSFYKHPFEMIANSIIGSLLIYATLGLNVEAGGIYTLCTALGEFFTHTNIKTPQWVGYIYQRPEMHRIHHEYNKHTNNYGNIVWWDMMFGTYENPKEFKATCGFDNEKEQRFLDMLKFKDVNKEEKNGKC